MNKKLAIFFPIFAAVMISGALWSTNQVNAETSDPISIIDRIAEKFNLNRDEVQQVFDEAKIEHQDMMQERLINALNEAVSEGKITSEQKEAILEKHNEIMANREAMMEEMKNMTPEERRFAMQNRGEDLREWAQNQGINLDEIMPKPEEGRGPKGREFVK